MKKACLSVLARLPAAPSPPLGLLLGAALLLSQPAWGDAVAPTPGAAAHLPRPAGSPKAYLPVLGPAPLRVSFPPAVTRTAQLPPLAMFDPPPLPEPVPPDATTNQLVELGPPAPPPPPPAPTAYGPPPPEAATSLVFDPALGAAPPEAIVTPQMLVQFFKPVGSNYLGGTWSVPMFVPPSPPATKSSTATYQTP